jgi:DNA (cytosine-5)-methyltransferase 1
MHALSVVDLFCGIGGMTHGFIKEGFRVIAGIDADPTCRYAYEANNRGVQFIEQDLDAISPEDVLCLYPPEDVKILIGCAPCQPFSKYTKRYAKGNKKDEKWRLVRVFGRLIHEVQADIVSMENVPELEGYPVFEEFVKHLEREDYHIRHRIVSCSDYGVPQMRKRLVLLASKFGQIDLDPNTCKKAKTVMQTIGALPAIRAGEKDPRDPIHRASGLSELNLRRIRSTSEGGTWRDWPKELILDCHRKESGRSYGSIYGRMRRHGLAPTITTEFHAIGSGRFGHPEQDRAISLREGALLQTFPKSYKFVKNGEDFAIGTIAKHIGNAVPVQLGQAIARSIKKHLQDMQLA